MSSLPFGRNRTPSDLVPSAKASALDDKSLAGSLTAEGSDPPMLEPTESDKVNELGAVIQTRERGDFEVEEGEKGIRLMDWPMAGVLCAKVAYGIGVMGIPASFATLGFVGGILSLISMWCLSTLAAVYVARMRVRHPRIHSVADFGGVLFGPIGAELFGAIYIVLMVLVTGAAINTCTIALNAISSHALCTMAWAGIASAIVFVFGAALPEMGSVAIISWIGIGCIFFANWILTIAVLVKGNPPEKPAGASLGITVKVNIPFWKAMTAVTSQLFACAGSPMFFSISAEMKRPEDFVKASLWGNSFLIANYLLIGIIMYARAGAYLSSPAFDTAGHTFRIICYSIALFGLFVSALLLTHVGAKYIFVRLLRGTKHLAHKTLTHRIVWAIAFLAVLGIGLLLSLAIPIFGDLVSLVGALTGGVLVVLLTAFMALYDLADDPDDPNQSQAMVTTRKTHWISQATKRGMHGTKHDKFRFAGAIILFILGVYISFTGLYATIASIVDAYNKGNVGGAFSCQDNSV